MSNKSGISSQVIPLPKGGGALQGIGEKFSVDPYTGTGNFTVPIALPSGRNGFQPELSLGYSSGNGNGPFGLGWVLSVPAISRKTAEGVPLYDDSEDTFLSGAEDPVLVPGDPQGATRYRLRTEGLFARIKHHQDDNEDFWEVRSKDGLVSVYGTPGAIGDDPAAVANSEDRSKVFAWKLTETEDPFGNRIVYAYESDPFEDDPRSASQQYLKCMQYVDYEDDSGEELFLLSVTFLYEDELGSGVEPRPDPFSDHRARFEIRTRRRWKRIEIRSSQ